MTKSKCTFNAQVTPEKKLKMHIRKIDSNNLYSCPCCGPARRYEMICNEYYLELLERVVDAR